MTASRGAGTVVLLAVLLGGCGPPASAPGPDVGTAGSPLAGGLTVFAAASTTDALEEVAGVFERRHPGVSVRLSPAGSQQLAAQLLAGAPADVFAAADPEQMQRVVDAGLTAGTPTTFATNRMTVVVAPGNPEGIGGVGDLAADGLVVVLAASEVPAGAYADRVLARAGVELAPDSRGPNVRQVLTKVTAGEADAAIVYRSDAVAAGGAVTTVPVGDDVNVTARYPVATLAGADDPRAARRFVGLLASATGRRILARHGFGAP